MFFRFFLGLHLFRQPLLLSSFLSRLLPFCQTLQTPEWKKGTSVNVVIAEMRHLPVVDPGLKLRGSPVLFYLPWRLFFLLSFLFFYPNLRRGVGASAPITRRVMQEKFPKKPYNGMLYWPSLFGQDGWILASFFFASLRNSTASRSINMQEKNFVNIQPSWPNKLGR